jgi:hypothetical protein
MRGFLSATGAACLMCGACATPPLELATGTENSAVYVGDVVQRVKCEISDAFVDKVVDRRFIWLRRWTVTTDLTLQATTSGAVLASASGTDIFHSAVNRAAGPTSFPGTNLGTIMQNFTFGLSGNVSEQALRSDLVSFTVAIDELMEWRRQLDERERALHIPPEKMTCNPGGHRELVGKLGLKEWVDAALDPVAEKYLTAGDHPSANARGPSKVPSGKSGVRGGGLRRSYSVLREDPSDIAYRQYQRYRSLEIAEDKIEQAERSCETYANDASSLPAKIEAAQEKMRNVIGEENLYGPTLSPIYARGSASLLQVTVAKVKLANSDKEVLAGDCAAIKRVAQISQDKKSVFNDTLTSEHDKLADATKSLSSEAAAIYEDRINAFHPTDVEVWDHVNEISLQLAADLTEATQKFSQAEAIHKDIPELSEELGVLAGADLPEPPVTAISHEVQFEVDYGAGFNPTWSLAVWKGPGLNGNLLSLNGTRMNLLQIAIGPRGEPALVGEEQKRILDHQTLLLR